MRHRCYKQQLKTATTKTKRVRERKKKNMPAILAHFRKKLFI